MVIASPLRVFLAMTALCGLTQSASAQVLYLGRPGSENEGTGTVSEYNATTGAPINASLITGFFLAPAAFAVSGSILYVTGLDLPIGEYNATTGAAINAKFITIGLNQPESLALSGNNLFVANFASNAVGIRRHHWSRNQRELYRRDLLS